MHKYQLLTKQSNKFHAGSKAPMDVSKIIEKLGYRVLYVKNSPCKNFGERVLHYISFKINYIFLFLKISKNGIVFIQYPHIDTGRITQQFLLSLKIKKNIKYITLIHDIDKLRNQCSDISNKSFDFISKLSDVIISHNKSMKKWLVRQGFNEKSIVDLEIFDYLIDTPIKTIKNFCKDITIAGNLDTKKVKYLSQIGSFSRIKFNLYGVNFFQDNYVNHNYEFFGKFPPEELPSKLNSGFGLVWDGISVETCKGDFGNYLRYNNPHKLSLYLASCLPVIIWKEAAEADFVTKNKIGLTVDSLKEAEDLLDTLTPETYNKLQQNTVKIHQKLISGYFTTSAIYKCEKKLENKFD